MLGKLLKYELKAMGRVLLPLYLVMIAACGLFAANIKLTEKAAIFEKFTLLTGLLMGFSIMAVTIVMIILILQRFYKNLLGTEGYMMFTLPVSTLEHILSKMISAFVWVVLGVAAGIGAGIIMISIFGEFQDFMKEFIEAMGILFDDNQIKLQICLVMILLIFGVTEGQVKVYAAIAVGHQMNTHRILFSVVAYVVFGVIETLLTMIPFIKEFMNGKALTTATLGQFPKIMIILLLGIAIYGTISWVLLDRRLNLE